MESDAETELVRVQPPHADLSAQPLPSQGALNEVLAAEAAAATGEAQLIAEVERLFREQAATGAGEGAEIEVRRIARYLSEVSLSVAATHKEEEKRLLALRGVARKLQMQIHVEEQRTLARIKADDDHAAAAAERPSEDDTVGEVSKEARKAGADADETERNAQSKQHQQLQQQAQGLSAIAEEDQDATELDA